MNEAVKKVVDFARTWHNRSIRNERGCPAETCAFFVRFVFRSVLHQNGIMSVAHSRPYYKENHIQALATSLNFADGLAGDVVGVRVSKNQVQPGDLLLFKDTYFSSEFPVGSITHVGIALDSNGMMADSSGGLCHVRNHKTTFPNKLVEVRRPRCFGVPQTGPGLTLCHGRVSQSGDFKEIKISYAGSSPKVLLDGKNHPYRYITVDIALGDGSIHDKLFHHDGQTKALVAGNLVSHLEVVAKLQGGLHLWVDGKEVKPSSANIGVT